MVLSNNHVLANENRARRGDMVLQPGPFDGGVRPDDDVAALARFVRLRKGKPNEVDGAVAAIGKNVELRRQTLSKIGRLAGLGPEFLDEGAAVAKVGRTTGTTRGRVTAFELDNLVVEFDIGDLTFHNQIEIEGAANGAFSDGGDSGSLIVNDAREAVALLFAGTELGGSNHQGLTYANPLRSVLDALHVDLVY
jgi:hypothetical protein